MKRVLDRDESLKQLDWLIEIYNNIDKSLQHNALELRKWFETFYYLVSKDFKESFGAFYNRFKHCNEFYNLESSLVAELDGIRIFLNKVIHGDIEDPTSQQIDAICFFFYELYKIFSQEDEQDKKFEAILANTELYHFTKIKKSTHKHVSELTISVESFELVKQDDGRFKSEIVGYDLLSEETVTVLVWDLNENENMKDSFKYGKKIGSIAKLLWIGCTVAFYNIKQNSEKNTVFFSQNNTTIVIEPDFLVDASTIAKCFQVNSAFHKIALISLFDRVDISIPIVIGNFVNQMLDRFIATKQTDFETVFKECVHSSVLTSLSLGVSKLLEIMKTIKQAHYPNLLNLCEKIKDYDITTEPTFFAPDYGLFGRLDGLIEGETDDSNRLSIFELKSGSVPKYNVWINHAVQVYIYDMLLKSNFGESRTGSSMIFYSSDQQGELRVVTPAPFMEQHILMVRNCLVSEYKALAEGRLEILAYLTSIDINRIPKFSQSRFEVIQACVGRLSPLEASYFTNYLGFLFREIWAVKTGIYTQSRDLNSTNLGFSSLWKAPLIAKEGNQRVLTGLKFHTQSENELIFERTKEKATLSLRNNDRVILYSQQDGKLSQVLKCTVTAIEADLVYLQPKNAEIKKELFSLNNEWIIENDSSDANLYGLIGSLGEFIQSSQENRDLLLGIQEPQVDPEFNYQDADDYLNSIIQKALSAKDYFLLQGPPGTGKTSSFLMKCISYLYHKSPEKVMILSFTNRAIDEVCLKLKQNNLPYLRIGNINNEDVYSLADLTSSHHKLQNIADEINTIRIFCSTVASYHANKNSLHTLISFDTLFIDEASQLLEPELIGITKNFSRFILIGDQNQLPAISIQAEEYQQCSDPMLNSIAIHNFKQSLFERLFANAVNKGWEHAYHTLTYHYRMHQDIADLINGNYENMLRTKIERQTSHDFLATYQDLENPIVKMVLSKSRCIFIDIPDMKSSRVSALEAQVVERLLHLISSNYHTNFTKESVGVICNWRSQINLIKEVTHNIPNQELITIDTVERYQGSERDIIIYSLTVNYHHQLELLQSLSPNRKVDRKLNVALSRPKEQIIIIGNAKLLSALPQYASLLERIKRSYLYISFNQARELFLN
ncbi:MAG: ATP-dependent helicase [Candidatus Cloacimonadales bacterium]